MTAPGDPPAPLTGQDAVDAVRHVVHSIPPGRVLTYGDVAELAWVGTARVPARILSRGLAGPDAPWWRVVNATGVLPRSLQSEAREHYAEEGIPLAPTDKHPVRVDLRDARWEQPPEFPYGP